MVYAGHSLVPCQSHQQEKKRRNPRMSNGWFAACFPLKPTTDLGRGTQACLHVLVRCVRHKGKLACMFFTVLDKLVGLSFCFGSDPFLLGLGAATNGLVSFNKPIPFGLGCIFLPPAPLFGGFKGKPRAQPLLGDVPPTPNTRPFFSWYHVDPPLKKGSVFTLKNRSVFQKIP